MYCRTRKSTFLEFLVVHGPDGMSLPDRPLNARFEGRIQRSCVIEGLHIFATTSIAGPPSKRTFDDIKSNGIWICFGDTVRRGGLSSVYGISLGPSVLSACKSIDKICEFMGCTKGPMVVYHGTHKDSMASILHEGLKASFGMLGTAVYLGSFWKAFRFATLTQDYKKRPGAICRYYAFWPTLVIRETYGPCACCASPVSDHTSVWKTIASAVFVKPGKHIKNEEFACADSSWLLLDSYGHAVATSDHHEPLNRNLRIL